MKTFGQVLELAEELQLDEQESLAEVLRRRVSEHRRAELIQAVKEARREFKAGRCRDATPQQIVKRLLA